MAHAGPRIRLRRGEVAAPGVTAPVAVTLEATGTVRSVESEGETRIATVAITATVDGKTVLGRATARVATADDHVQRVVADLDLPLHRLDQRRHRVAELFATRETVDA